MVMEVRGVIPPTTPSRITSPVPAVNTRLWAPSMVLVTPEKVMSPAPGPVEMVTSPPKVVGPVMVILLLPLVRLLSRVNPPAAV